MSDVRSHYLDVVRVALGVLTSPEVESRWSDPSALRDWSVGGLAGHLGRAVMTVEQYLDADAAPEGRTLTPGGYFAAVVDSTDLDSDLHRGIRERGEETATGGHAALTERVAGAADRLRSRLSSEPSDRRVAVLKGVVLPLDDYLATRIVELVIHTDDLAVSVDLPTPEFSAEVYPIAVDVLIDTARQRHGDLAIVRALTRRERDAIQALRVF